MRRIFALLVFVATPATAQESLQARVEAKLGEAGPGVRFGLVVAGEDGKEIVAVNPDGRFIPASNTKMFTTAAAFATLPGIDQPDTTGGATVRIEGRDVVLEGHGDARLSSAADCTVDCLAALADAVAAKTRVVRDVIGDDTLFPDERWSPGMSWNNIPSRSGTGISALTLDDNELPAQVIPGVAGEAPKLDTLPYFEIENRAVTVASGKTDIGFDRMPLSRTIRMTGTIVAGAEPEKLRFGIDDPADYAAWRLKTLLEARGVRVTGKALARHRPLSPSDDPAVRKGAPAPRPPLAKPLAKLTPAPLIEDLTFTNKVSQNLHAELFLRRVAVQQGSGSIADGVAVVEAMLAGAGVPRRAYDFSDGSGMSTYNRVAPRGVVVFLRWVAAQPWGAAWRGTLPNAGADGTLARRFKGTPLEGKLFAKTGTLNATNALSGYMVGKSGRTLTFSVFANDVPEGVSATKAMDAALELIAAEN
ncbi:D-alanyl-D-alanine carboxypeptidase/D-alanyl-D-alanine-endopeptidase [Sphingomonas sp. JC676]|uniref:D-alanyl-D-alanine carboxypeptidase/D-alanyl-D-alanine endopeptidase n=1 Tax=Sphingomonas sp. JC676 TaxID=2768065 RepID=UPI00165845A9|nr:D-alanyl-D-alanine carboxypeptidase/D-alanyl-D-alanine-endopeptidase [Sphingomonas sp. JC676]MBC9033099.1 D-alanyl-D-alanine carboxypeptidase/D-alanyl-D-alanine-endopeptidase [Sphingomonas sp. JC676]